MNRKLRWLLILVTLAAFAVWLEPTRVIWGWVRGEAFYDSRPTSWWASELSAWDAVFEFNDGRVISVMDDAPWGGGVVYPEAALVEDALYRRTNWHQRLWQFLMKRPNLEPGFSNRAPSLLIGDPSSNPVLRVLAEQPSWRIRFLAQHGLRQLAKKTE